MSTAALSALCRRVADTADWRAHWRPERACTAALTRDGAAPAMASACTAAMVQVGQAIRRVVEASMPASCAGQQPDASNPIRRAARASEGV